MVLWMEKKQKNEENKIKQPKTRRRRSFFGVVNYKKTNIFQCLRVEKFF